MRDGRGVRRLHRFAAGTLPVCCNVEVIRRVLGQPLPCPSAHRDHGKAGGGREALLRAGDGDINTPLVGLDQVAADGGDAVHDEEGIVLPAELPDLFGRVFDTRRGLVVDERDDLRPGLELCLKGLEVDRGTPVDS